MASFIQARPEFSPLCSFGSAFITFIVSLWTFFLLDSVWNRLFTVQKILFVVFHSMYFIRTILVLMSTGSGFLMLIQKDFTTTACVARQQKRVTKASYGDELYVSRKFGLKSHYLLRRRSLD